MKIIFYAIGMSISDIIQIGEIELVGDEMRYSGKAANIVADITVIEPNTLRVLTPVDGETWLRAIPYEFRSPYLMADFQE